MGRGGQGLRWPAAHAGGTGAVCCGGKTPGRKRTECGGRFPAASSCPGPWPEAPSPLPGNCGGSQEPTAGLGSPSLHLPQWGPMCNAQMGLSSPASRASRQLHIRPLRPVLCHMRMSRGLMGSWWGWWEVAGCASSWVCWWKVGHGKRRIPGKGVSPFYPSAPMMGAAFLYPDPSSTPLLPWSQLTTDLTVSPNTLLLLRL